MDVIKRAGAQPRECGGFSVVMAEKVLALAGSLGLRSQWAELRLGNVSRRCTAYTVPQRISALLAGLACGLRGIAPGNMVLRTNTALQQATGGRFPDQGTIHRWLEQTTPDQAHLLRRHLHQSMRTHGQFWKVLRSQERLVVDLDGQGLVARGKKRFQGAEHGYLGDGMDCGYQRFVAYVGQTREVLDEVIRPGAAMLTTELPGLLDALNEIFAPEWRERIVIRADAHGGTVNNLHALCLSGYHYACRMMAWSGRARLQREKCSGPGRVFSGADATGAVHPVECWDVPSWTFGKRHGPVVHTRVVVFREVNADGTPAWLVLLTDLTDATPEDLWALYHQRGGTIEEYNDQSERAFHLDVIRTGCLAGLNALHALIAVCWNLTEWAAEELTLPPLPAPQADPTRWVPARSLDRSHLLWRASHSGLRLFRAGRAALEVEDTAATPESAAWRRWLRQPIQHRFRLAG